jgi:hypothetical protein
MKNADFGKESSTQANEDQSQYVGFINKSEDEKLRDKIMRPALEKLQLFTKMLRRESVLKSGKISHT